MRFTSEFTLDIITEALRLHSKFASERAPDKPVSHLGVESGSETMQFISQKYECYKIGWAMDQRKPVVLEVTPGFLNQIDASMGNVLLKSYPYKDIKQIIPVKDRPGKLFCYF